MDNLNDNCNQVTPFAVTNFRDIKKRFGIKQKNRRGHMYVIGQTGTGKTTLLENMVISDIEAGNGLAVIDPGGDMAENILNCIPQNRTKDVLYFNPSDVEYPVGLNPLGKTATGQDHLIASGIISVFKKTWPEFWGPRLEHILRNAILTLVEIPQSTLLDLPPLLTDKVARGAMVSKIKSQQVREFWLNEFEKYSAWFRSEATAPILNKIGQYLAAPLLRNIFGQSQGAVDIRSLMDNKGIFIANLSKGRIGEDNCSLLGAMLVTLIQLGAYSRANIPEKERTPFYLYVDEVHSFATSSFVDALSEVRKYGLGLVLAHQYLDQLDEKVRAAILGNAGTLISFRVGSEDARHLAREFYPTFNESDLLSLANHNIYLKLLIDGYPSKPFSAVTLAAPTRQQSFKHEVVRASRASYGRKRVEVEKEIVSGSNRPNWVPNGLSEQRLPI